jgi:hypothetical protein
MLEPLVESVPFQKLLIVTPLGSVPVTVHALIVDEPLFCAVTLAWKPPCHELTIEVVAEQVPGAPVGAVGLGLTARDGHHYNHHHCGLVTSGCGI